MYRTASAYLIHKHKLKAHNQPILANFLSTTFYDLKVTLGYIGESHESFMSKYTQEVRASLDILNTKRLISPEREGFRGSNFVSFILRVYMFCR